MTPKLPNPGTRPDIFLRQLLAGPGTFLQICERAQIELSTKVETDLRNSVSRLESQRLVRLVRLDRLTYHLTDLARAALSGAPAAEYVGQVAGPAFRGVTHLAPVTIVRRPAQAVRP